MGICQSMCIYPPKVWTDPQILFQTITRGEAYSQIDLRIIPLSSISVRTCRSCCTLRYDMRNRRSSVRWMRCTISLALPQSSGCRKKKFLHIAQQSFFKFNLRDGWSDDLFPLTAYHLTGAVNGSSTARQGEILAAWALHFKVTGLDERLVSFICTHWSPHFGVIQTSLSVWT